jgi:hypothetical protein
MAAQGGIRDKILRVSMPFQKGRTSRKRSTLIAVQKRPLLRVAADPWSVVLKVHSWAKKLKEERVRSFAEIARIEGITRARVSQLWPLTAIKREQIDKALTMNNGREISLRRLIRIARNSEVKRGDLGAENLASE